MLDEAGHAAFATQDAPRAYRSRQRMSSRLRDVSARYVTIARYSASLIYGLGETGDTLRRDGISGQNSCQQTLFSVSMVTYFRLG